MRTKNYCVFYCCRARKKRYLAHRTGTRFFFKYLYVRVRLIDGGAVKKHLATVREKNKSNNLEPHFPTWATKSRSLEDTKTAVALPHCSGSTKDSIAGWWTFWLEVTPELWRNYGTSYVKKTEVEVLPVVDLSAKSAFQFFFCGRCNTGAQSEGGASEHFCWYP